MDQFSYPVQCAAAQVLASASKVKRIQGHLQEAGEGCDCCECQLYTRGSPLPAVGQICTTDSARRVICLFPRAMKKDMALS